MRRYDTETAVSCFIVESISVFIFHNFRLWEELVTYISASKKSYHLLCVVSEHWELNTK